MTVGKFKVMGIAALAVVSLTGAPLLTPAVAQETPAESLSEDLSGRITFDFVNWIRHETEAIVDVTLPNGEFRRSASGRFGWRHANGDLVRLLGCGNYVNRLVIDRASGESEIVSPCSSEIQTPGGGRPQFEFSRISPNKKYIAAELKYYFNSQWRYSVVIIEGGKIIASYDGHAAPEWLPDGRLIITGNGLYVTEVGGTPTRLDDGWLGVGVNNPAVSPNGEIIVFEWNERLWIMDSDGKEHKELVSGPDQYRFPVWSPDGNYVAFIATGGASHSEVDRALHLIDIRVGEFQRIDLRPFAGPLNHVPYGPLSWTP